MYEDSGGDPGPGPGPAPQDVTFQVTLPSINAAEAGTETDASVGDLDRTGTNLTVARQEERAEIRSTSVLIRRTSLA